MSAPTCPVCASEISGPTVRCHRCEVVYHEDCYAYVGRCAIFGCSRPATSLVTRMIDPVGSPGARVTGLALVTRTLGRNVAIMFASLLLIPSVIIMAARGLEIACLVLGVLSIVWGYSLSRSESPVDASAPGEPLVKTRMILSVFGFALMPEIWCSLLVVQIGVLVLCGAVQWARWMCEGLPARRVQGRTREPLPARV